MTALTAPSPTVNKLYSIGQRVKYFIRGRMMEAVNRAKKRIRVELLSGPPGIFSGEKFGTTGMTRKSLRSEWDKGSSTGTRVGSNMLKVWVKLGGHAPKYPNVVSGVQRIMAEEARRAVDQMRRGVAMLARGTQVAGLDISSIETPDIPEAPTGFTSGQIGRGEQAKFKRKQLVREARKAAKAAGINAKTHRDQRNRFVYRFVNRVTNRDRQREERAAARARKRGAK